MNFAPFAFEHQSTAAASPLPDGLTVNLWQGNYTAGSQTWTNSAPGSTAVVSNIPTGGYPKNATGVMFTGTTRSRLFRIASDGVWDNTAGYTIIIYMHVTSTTNKTFWSKQTSNNNGMGVDFTNNPYLNMRAWGSSNQITTTATIPRGSLQSYGFASNSGGTTTNNQYYINSSAVTTTVQASILSNFWNNGSPFDFGYSLQWTDPSIQGYLNRILIFNRKLTTAEVGQCYTYMDANK